MEDIGKLVKATEDLEAKVGAVLDSTEKSTQKTKDEMIAAQKDLRDGISELRVSVDKATATGNTTDETVKAAILRLTDLERRFGRAAGTFNSDAPADSTTKSVGGQFGDWIKANSEYVEKARRAGNRVRQSDNVAIEGVTMRQSMRALDILKANGLHATDENIRKVLLLTDATNFSPVSRQPNLMPMQSYRLVMRDLIPSRPINVGNFEYLEYMGLSETTERSMTSISSAALVATAETAAAHGLRVGDRVRIAGSSDTEYNGYFHVVSVTTSTGFTYHMLTDPSDDSADGTITWNPISRGGAMVPKAENALKLESQLAPLLRTGKVESIAHIQRVTRQALDDVEGLQADINTFGIQGLMLEEERQMLYGDGTSPNLQGILDHAGRQTYTQAVAGSVGLVSTVRHAQTMLELVGGRATAIVINPLDWESMELAVGLDDHFLFRNGPEGGNNPVMWSTRVLSTKSIAPGTVLVGAFDVGAVIYDRQAANIAFADQDGDDFKYNRVAIRIEERLGLAVTRPEMFVDLTLS